MILRLYGYFGSIGLASVGAWAGALALLALQAVLGACLQPQRRRRELPVLGMILLPHDEVKKAAHLQNPAVRYFQTARIDYEYEEEAPAHLDGELIFSTSFKVDLLPGALRMIFDPRGEHYFKV